MHTIALAASKGGVGKTTLCAALAVRAAEESGRVGLIDLDPQKSLGRWWELRNEPINPRWFQNVDDVDHALEVLEENGYEWVFIDTPPGLIGVIESAIVAADFVLCPTRASAIDVEAVDPVLEFCQQHGKPLRFILNAAEPRWGLTGRSVAYLQHEGKVLKPWITYRHTYIAAMTVGQSGAELVHNGKRDTKARDEIAELWLAVKKLVGAKPKQTK
jgi:chromosome partitioning protein